MGGLLNYNLETAGGFIISRVCRQMTDKMGVLLRDQLVLIAWDTASELASSLIDHQSSASTEELLKLFDDSPKRISVLIPLLSTNATISPLPGLDLHVVPEPPQALLLHAVL
ncbi:hypothetical protein M0R45_033338 [Rubus argutus]|uniref:Uncharacterized protein n=1 Tax=Rubus argutus TaxID=59490 RepID=A0AAW1WJZ0_RUBAR